MKEFMFQHTSEVPADLDDPTDSSSSLNQLLVHLPEELILFLLSCGVKNPAYRCQLVLDPDYKTNIDRLLVLQHSIFIKEIKHLSFHFTCFYPSSKLAPSLLRCLYLLRTLTHVEEVALYFPSIPEYRALGFFGLDSFAEDENHIQRMVLVCENLLNQIVLKSSKTIHVSGLAGLLSHVYDFRKESPSGKSSGGPLKSPARLLAGVKDYFDRRQSKKNSKDPVILDEARYSRARSSLKRSRLFLQCSPEALKQTQLTCLRVDSPDFFRPPFSQWVFPMLQASNLHTLSFSCSHRPKDTEEVEFILQRLATAIPNLNRLHLSCVKKEVLLILMKWINMFAHLQTLVIEPSSFDASNEQAGLLDTPNSTLPNFNNTQTAPFSFAPHIRHIKAPYQFLTYFASIASSSPSPLPKDGHQSRFPALQMIWLYYDCVRRIKFDPHVLANALRHIRPVLLPPRLADGTSDSSNSSSASLIVQIKFDRRFRGLASALTMDYSNTINAQSKNLPNSSTSNNEVENVSADMFELSKIEYLCIRLPGNRKQILQGEFDDQIILVLSHFGGLRALRLASDSEFADSKPPEKLSPSHSMVFKEGRPGLTEVEVSGSR